MLCHHCHRCHYTVLRLHNQVCSSYHQYHTTNIIPQLKPLPQRQTQPNNDNIEARHNVGATLSPIDQLINSVKSLEQHKSQQNQHNIQQNRPFNVFLKNTVSTPINSPPPHNTSQSRLNEPQPHRTVEQIREKLERNKLQRQQIAAQNSIVSAPRFDILPVHCNSFSELLSWADSEYKLHSHNSGSILLNNLFDTSKLTSLSPKHKISNILQQSASQSDPSPFTDALLAALRSSPRAQPNRNHRSRRPVYDPKSMRNAHHDKLANRFNLANATLTPQANQLTPAQFKQKRVNAQQKQKEIHINARQTVARLSQVMKVPTNVILQHLSDIGHKAKTVNDYIDGDSADIVVRECGFIPIKQQSALQLVKNKSDSNTVELPRRGPVVCVAGHVDHGKTTLLDSLRDSNIAAGEAGGITQAIGAFQVDLNINDVNIDMSEDDRIGAVATFLDTPGHAAFANMRARGISSSCVDMLVLVVSAVDGIQPQTIEAIKLATTNNVPIVVAINKCDLYGADSNAIQLELLKFDVVTEQHGGDVQCVDISALKRTGLDTLKEALLLTAEMSDLRSSRTDAAQCYVVESKVDRSSGNVLNVVVRSGCLKVGDIVVSGSQYGKVRALIDENGTRINTVGPSTGVQLLGFDSLDGIDSECIVVQNESIAQTIVRDRSEAAETESADIYDIDVDTHGINPINQTERYKAKRGRRYQVAARTLTPEEKIMDDEKQATTLNLIVKSDVGGTLEALLSYIDMLELCSNEVSAVVVKSGLGEISETDLLLAQETNSCIVAFNIQPNAKIESMVKNMKLNLISNSIIYNIMDYISTQLTERLPPLIAQSTAGTIDVAAIFDIKSKRGTKICAAGCKVISGEITTKHTIRVLRDGNVVYDNGIIDSLKHFKDEVSSVKKDNECGLVVRGFTDWQVGDTIECIATTVTPRVFNDALARGNDAMSQRGETMNKSNNRQNSQSVYKQ